MIEIAHRGHSKFYKDNTIKAFIDAFENDFEMIELDVVLTKDKKIAIYHDTFINKKLIKDIKYLELKKMDQDIILLESFFKMININRINIYIDIKGNNEISKYLHAILKDKSKEELENIYLASFNTLILNDLHKLNPDYQFGLITENLFENDIYSHYINKFNLKFIAFNWTNLNKNTIDFLHKNNILVFTYTCNNNNTLLFMKKFNIDGIITNYKINIK